MGIMDSWKEATKRVQGQVKGSLGSEDKPDALLTLSSLGEAATFFKDRIETRNRIGTKFNTIYYHQVTEVTLDKGSPFAPTNKKTILVRVNGAITKLDFRAEPLPKIRQALDLINKGVGESHSVGVVKQTSGADELEKLALLKDKGIITQAEFDAKKKQLLNL
jgi:hypothetical protein